MPKYVVYEQRAPIRSGTENNGDPIYKANLIAVGVIDAPYAKRFTEARKLVPYPVIEEMANESHQH